MRTQSACLTLLFLAGSLYPGIALAEDYSHARIVRLSLAQGDVRFSHAGGDAGWEAAVANLPIREGYVVATGEGRAAVEFEHGAAAYLAENSTLEFTQLGLSDGAFITHMKLSQGTATFYAHPGGGDQFGVAAPTLDVSLEDKGSFRLDVTSDGTWVSILSGQVRVQYEDGSREMQLENGHMLALRTGETEPSIEAAPPEDDFDKWVAGREETLTTETTAAQQYANSPAYTAGLADLAAYGAWMPYASFGYCWRPFGVGLGWVPFMSGIWTFDPFFGGWNWISYEPWGWLPYHFGGWVYSPIYGWLWAPGGGLGGPWRPLTGAWIGHPHGPIGIVPLHPLDRPGKIPLNAAAGFLIVPGAGANKGTGPTLVHLLPGERVQVVGQPASHVLVEGFVPAHAPVPSTAPASRRVFVASPQAPGPTTNAAGAAAAGAASSSRSSSIVFDPRSKQFVNVNPAPQDATSATGATADGTAVTARPAKRSAGASLPGSGAAANAAQPVSATVPAVVEPAVNAASRPVHHAREGTTPPNSSPQGPHPSAGSSGSSAGGPHASGGGGGSAGSSSHGSGGGASSGHSSGGGSGSHGGSSGGSSGGGGGSGSGHGSGGGHSR